MKVLKGLIALLFLIIPQWNFSQTVYVTSYGDKYHKYDCQYLYNSRIATSSPQARYAGYSPCSVCKPDYVGATVLQGPQYDPLEIARQRAAMERENGNYSTNQYTNSIRREPKESRPVVEKTLCNFENKNGNGCLLRAVYDNGRCQYHRGNGK